MKKTFSRTEVLEMMKSAYDIGFDDGIVCFSWWKDGRQLVGTCGTTLKEARKKMAQGILYNYKPDYNILEIIREKNVEFEGKQND